MEAFSEPALIQFLAVWGLAIITVFYCSSILLELALYRRLGDRAPADYDVLDGAASFTVNLMSSFSDALLRVFLPLAVYVFVYSAFALLDLGFAGWTVPLAFVIHECAYYFGHRLSHRTGIGWAFHHPHHSSEHLNLTTSSRGFLFGDPLGNLLGLSAALIGIHPGIYFGVILVKNMWGIWNHTQLVGKMGRLDNWMATPANHRVHHGRNPQYIDKNYSQVTVVLDRILGTFEPEVEPPEFGLVTPQLSNNPLHIWFGGFRWLGARIRSAPDLPTKLAYLWKPPEWTHTGEPEGCIHGQCEDEFVAAE